MSQTESHLGKLYPVKMESSLEETCKKIAKRHNIELGEDWQEDFRENFNEYEHQNKRVDEEYFIHGETLYRVINHEESSDDDCFMKLGRNSDGSISFTGQFYNSATCFSEMLEEALDNLKPSYNEQFRDAIKKILEDKTIKPPVSVPSACLLLAQHVGLDESIELIEGVIKENKDNIFKSLAYETALDYIKNELK
jgi:hypothetical protein